MLFRRLPMSGPKGLRRRSGGRNCLTLGVSDECPKDAVSTASQGISSDADAGQFSMHAAFGNYLKYGISSLGPVGADAVSTASADTGPQWGKHKPNNAKRPKIDAVSTASGGGVLEPGILQAGDAVSTASSSVGFNKGFELALKGVCV